MLFFTSIHAFTYIILSDFVAYTIPFLLRDLAISYTSFNTPLRGADPLPQLLKLNLCQSSPYPNSSQRELVSQECSHTGGTSHSHRQQDHLTSAITRWQETRARTLATETKATWNHQKPVLPPHQTPDTTTQRKSKTLI